MLVLARSIHHKQVCVSSLQLIRPSSIKRRLCIDLTYLVTTAKTAKRIVVARYMVILYREKKELEVDEMDKCRLSFF